jgi:hypothetical protein
MIRTLFALLTLAAVPSSEQFLGIDVQGDVFRMDSFSAGTTFLGASGFTSVGAMARDSSGTVYAIADSAPGASQLVRINPATGAGTAVSTIALGDIQGAAFDAADVLYVVVSAPTLVGGGGSDLWTVDVLSGAATYVGYTASRDALQGLAFGGGKLYAWDLGYPGLTVVDTATAAATPVGPPTALSSNVTSLHFGTTGTLYGAGKELHALDPATGVATLIGPSAYDVRGMETDADFSGTPERLSVFAGGTQTLVYNAGPTFAGESYLVLGTVSGTTPGTSYSGLTIPLNLDSYLVYTLLNPNNPLLPASGGALDASGSAQLAFVLPPASSPSLIGLTAHHAGVVLRLVGGAIEVVHASQAAPVTLDP